MLSKDPDLITRRLLYFVVVLAFLVQYFLACVAERDERILLLLEGRALCIAHTEQITRYCDVHVRLNAAYQTTLHTLMEHLGLWHKSRLTEYVQLPLPSVVLGVGGPDGESDEW